MAGYFFGVQSNSTKSSKASLGMLLAGVVFLVLAGSAIADESVRETVRCREIAFSQAVENQQPEQFFQMLDTDTRFISHEVLQGASAVAQAWAGFFESAGPQLVWRPFIVEVAASGDLAFSRGPYRMRHRNEAGELIESWGIYNSVWRKAADGQWKILFDAGNAGEEQLNDGLKALIDQPIEGCQQSPAG